ncbi:hypothetical protein LIA77_09334 [Sarocladium implicatum]|nr:hypothetical protein LIA77_09334 [Sarocladium implicatum]
MRTDWFDMCKMKAQHAPSQLKRHNGRGRGSHAAEGEVVTGWCPRHPPLHPLRGANSFPRVTDLHCTDACIHCHCHCHRRRNKLRRLHPMIIHSTEPRIHVAPMLPLGFLVIFPPTHSILSRLAFHIANVPRHARQQPFLDSLRPAQHKHLPPSASPQATIPPAATMSLANKFPSSGAFDAIAAALSSEQERKDAIKSGKAIFGFTLKNPAGETESWNIDLKNTGTVNKGLGEKPTGEFLPYSSNLKSCRWHQKSRRHRTGPTGSWGATIPGI